VPAHQESEYSITVPKQGCSTPHFPTSLKNIFTIQDPRSENIFSYRILH
jgi:hypothetical protein